MTEYYPTEYYECHITCIGDPKEIKPKIEALNWAFSSIDGDLVLGEGIKCYATKHYPAMQSMIDVFINLRHAVDNLEQRGVHVIRHKIEKIIYDSRA